MNMVFKFEIVNTITGEVMFVDHFYHYSDIKYIFESWIQILNENGRIETSVYGWSF